MLVIDANILIRSELGIRVRTLLAKYGATSNSLHLMPLIRKRQNISLKS